MAKKGRISTTFQTKTFRISKINMKEKIVETDEDNKQKKMKPNSTNRQKCGFCDLKSSLSLIKQIYGRKINDCEEII